MKRVFSRGKDAKIKGKDVFNYSDNVLEMFFSRGFLYVQLCRF